jgi:hypothetical protein
MLRRGSIAVDARNSSEIRLQGKSTTITSSHRDAEAKLRQPLDSSCISNETAIKAYRRSLSTVSKPRNNHSRAFFPER